MDLSGTRLGRGERRLLLEAPAFAERRRVPILPPPLTSRPSGAAQVSLRRSVAKLRRCGLLEVVQPRVVVGQKNVESLAVLVKERGWVPEDDDDLRRLCLALTQLTKPEWKHRARLRFMRRTPLGDALVAQADLKSTPRRGFFTISQEVAEAVAAACPHR